MRGGVYDGRHEWQTTICVRCSKRASGIAYIGRIWFWGWVGKILKSKGILSKAISPGIVY